MLMLQAKSEHYNANSGDTKTAVAEDDRGTAPPAIFMPLSMFF